MTEYTELSLSLSKSAGKELSSLPGSTFSLSTEFDRTELIEEELIWDKTSSYETAKSLINKRCVSEISNISGRTYLPLGSDHRVVLNLISSSYRIFPEPIFFFGRYSKLKTGMSQTRWMCGWCSGRGCKRCQGIGKKYADSVEECIGRAFRKHSGCSDFVLHASGREDVDVSTSAGRPFVFEISGWSHFPDLRSVESDVSKEGKVSVRDLVRVPPSWVELVCSSHFDKKYRAIVKVEEYSLGEAQKILSLSNSVISQRTPSRVSRRRADKIRRRRILEISILEEFDDGFEMVVLAEAGTYIKEFISGDSGRTTPSISSVLKKNCFCSELEVIGILDGFLDTVRIPEIFSKP